MSGKKLWCVPFISSYASPFFGLNCWSLFSWNCRDVHQRGFWESPMPQQESCLPAVEIMLSFFCCCRESQIGWPFFRDRNLGDGDGLTAADRVKYTEAFNIFDKHQHLGRWWMVAFPAPWATEGWPNIVLLIGWSHPTSVNECAACSNVNVSSLLNIKDLLYAFLVVCWHLHLSCYPLVIWHNYGKSPVLMEKLTVSMANFLLN